MRTTFASIRFDFAEDLHISSSSSCSSLEANISYSCIPCNYSSLPNEEGLCSGSIHSDPSLLTNITLSPSSPNCNCSANFCSLGGPLLSPSQPFGDSLTSYTTKFYRFQNENPKEGFRVQITPLNGSMPTVYILSAPYIATETIISGTGGFGYGSFEMLCPSNAREGAGARTVTYFIAVSLFQKAIAEYTIVVTSVTDYFQCDPQKIAIASHFQNGNLSVSSFYDPSNSSLLISDLSFASSLLVFYNISRDDGCSEYVFSAEIVHYGNLELFVGTILQSQLPLISSSEALVELITKQASTLKLSSGGTVYSVCPRSQTEPTILFVFLSSSFVHWDIILHVFDAAKLKVKKEKISEVSELRLIAAVSDSIFLECPCLPEDQDCLVTHSTVHDYNKWIYLNDLTNDDIDFSHEFSYVFSQEMLFRCRSQRFVTTSACSVIRVIPTFTQYNPSLYPMFSFVVDLAPFGFPDPFKVPLPNSIVSTSISFLVVLQSKYQLSTTVINDERFRKCTVQFANPSRFLSLDGASPSFDPIQIDDIPPRPSECTSEGFEDVFALILNMGTQIGFKINFLSAVNSQDMNSYLYAISSLTFSEEYAACEVFTDLFILRNDSSYAVVNTSKCLNYTQDDSCCNTDVEWALCCEAEGRNQTVKPSDHDSLIPYSINYTLVFDECVSPECSSLTLEDFDSLLFQVRLMGRCGSSETQPKLYTQIGECRDQYIGSDFLGFPCVSDFDCGNFSFGGSVSVCDVSVGRCVNTLPYMEYKFVRCFVDILPSSYATALMYYFVQNNLTSPDFLLGNEAISNANLTALLLESLQTTAFVSDYGPMAAGRTFYSLTVIPNADDVCSSCQDVRCLMESTCEVPEQCLDNTALCRVSWIKVTDPIVTVCNTGNMTMCDTGEEACMFCYSSTNCIVFHNISQSDCPNTSICAGNSAYSLSVSEEDCPAFVASHHLENSNCSYCHDPDKIYETVLRLSLKIPTLANATKGVCLLPLQPFNLPSCPYIGDPLLGSSLDFSTRRGCVSFSQCNSEGLFNGCTDCCVHILKTPEECANIEQPDGTMLHGRWLPLPIPREYCEDENLTYCADSNVILPERIFDVSNLSSCQECGKTVSLPGMWVDNCDAFTYQKLTWRKAEKTNTSKLSNSTIDFVKLDGIILQLTNTILALYDSFRYLCAYRPFVIIYMDIACGCTDSIQNVSAFEQCQGIEKNISGETISDSPFSGILYLCPDEETYAPLLAGGLISVFLPNTPDPSVTVLCDLAYLFLAWEAEFTGNHTSEPKNVFADPSMLNHDPVRNSIGASVGSPIGDGFFLNFSNPFTPIYNITLSVRVIVNLTGLNEGYKVYDFGVMVDPQDRYFPNELELRPLGTTAELVYDQIGDPFVIGTVLIASPSPSVTPKFYPIARFPNWENTSLQDQITHSEEIMLYVFSALYAVTCIFVLVVLLLTLFKFSSSQFVLHFLGALILLFRAVYIGLYAGGYLRNTNAAALVLIELPCFIYVSYVSVLVMSFSYAYLGILVKESDHRHMEKYASETFHWIVWLALQLGLYLVFGLIIALMIALPSSVITTSSSCDNRVVKENRDDTINDIRIIYHTIALVMATICGLCLMILGKGIQEKLHSVAILEFSFTGALGLFLSSLNWLIYSIVQNTTASPYFVIPLFIFDAIPIFYITWKLRPRNIRRLYYMTKDEMKEKFTPATYST